MADTEAVRIPVRPGRSALVDKADERLVRSYTWRIVQAHGSSYAVATYKQVTVHLHRLVLHAPKGRRVRFKNGDTLDCRRENLELTQQPRANGWKARYARLLAGMQSRLPEHAALILAAHSEAC